MSREFKTPDVEVIEDLVKHPGWQWFVSQGTRLLEAHSRRLLTEEITATNWQTFRANVEAMKILHQVLWIPNTKLMTDKKLPAPGLFDPTVMEKYTR